ncbi:hypothetical protein L2E82_44892 [Cichorium intybus]|uniref:Uncharacterized protein n=1 Tax=Cichorium intybus TaxID=13427 RepID=A0ACB8ZVX6_CICIN|nr:hypothetical protein L2E82_44892 [Cichorium intybus]
MVATVKDAEVNHPTTVPGEPYPVEKDIPPTPAPAPLFIVDVAVNQNNDKAHVPYGWIIASLGAVLALIIAVTGFLVCLRSSICFDDTHGIHAKDQKDEKISLRFHILRTTSFCCGSNNDDWRENIGESSDRHMNIPKESNLLGLGTYGAVYYGLLPDQLVTTKDGKMGWLCNGSKQMGLD